MLPWFKEETLPSSQAEGEQETCPGLHHPVCMSFERISPRLQLLVCKASGFTEHLVDAIGRQGDPGSHR